MAAENKIATGRYTIRNVRHGNFAVQEEDLLAADTWPAGALPHRKVRGCLLCAIPFAEHTG